MECCPGTQDSWSVSGFSSQFTSVVSGYDPITSHSHRSRRNIPEPEPLTLPPTTCHSSCRATIRGPTIRSKSNEIQENRYKMMQNDAAKHHITHKSSAFYYGKIDGNPLHFRVTLRQQPPSNGTDRASQIVGFPTNDNQQQANCWWKIALYRKKSFENHLRTDYLIEVLWLLLQLDPRTKRIRFRQSVCLSMEWYHVIC